MNFPTSAIFTNVLISGTKGIIEETVLSMSISLAKSRAHLKMCNIRIVAKDYPNHTLQPTPKKKILNTKTKKLLEDEV